MAKPLNERLASALSTDRVTSTDLAALIERATEERDRFLAIVEQANGDSINFALTEVDRDEAASKAEKARREANALSNAIDQLETKLAAKRDSEASRAREAEREAILAERDALADRARDRWPAIEAEMLDLLVAMKASDERMKAAGIFEPGAEMTARGLNAPRIGVSPVRLLSEMKIPSFAEPTQLAWPRSDLGHQMGRINDEGRQAILAHHKRQDEENARFSRYHVTPPNGARSPFVIEARNGLHDVSRRGVTLSMSQEQVAEARRVGCSVEPAKNGEVIGMPQSVGFLT